MTNWWALEALVCSRRAELLAEASGDREAFKALRGRIRRVLDGIVARSDLTIVNTRTGDGPQGPGPRRLDGGVAKAKVGASDLAPQARGGCNASVAVVSLGAHDPERLASFYSTAGWPVLGDDGGGTVFGIGPLAVRIVPLAVLADRANALGGSFRPGLRSTIGVLVRTPSEVDEMVSALAGAGAVVTRPPSRDAASGDRTAFLSDPEGNFWEFSSRCE